MWILGPIMALLALLSLGCLTVRDKTGQLPPHMSGLAAFFGFGAMACLYLLITGGGGD